MWCPAVVVLSFYSFYFIIRPLTAASPQSRHIVAGVKKRYASGYL